MMSLGAFDLFLRHKLVDMYMNIYTLGWAFCYHIIFLTFLATCRMFRFCFLLFGCLWKIKVSRARSNTRTATFTISNLPTSGCGGPSSAWPRRGVECRGLSLTYLGFTSVKVLMWQLLLLRAGAGTNGGQTPLDLTLTSTSTGLNSTQGLGLAH